MIKRSDLLAMSYYEKAVYTGADGPFRFRISRGAREDGRDVFEGQLWEGPFASDYVEEADKKTHRETFDEEGLQRLVDWMNGEVRTWKRS